jgi:hypothetical protein
MPADEHANDIVHHQTRFVTDDLEAALRALQAKHYQLISSGVVTLPKAQLGFHSAVIVKDPDGHPIVLSQK